MAVKIVRMAQFHVRMDPDPFENNLLDIVKKNNVFLGATLIVLLKT